MAEKQITLPVVNLAGENVGTIDLESSVFGVTEKNEQAVHDAVVAQQANARQATAKTKKRHEVQGGGKKPWRQKGTGRARAGSSRSPLWVGGGKIFGPDGNQNYDVSQNKKAHAIALRTVLSQRALQGLIIVDAVKLGKVSTKEFVKALAAIKAEGKTLIISSDPAVLKSARNVKGLTLRAVKNISVYDVLNSPNLVIGQDDVVTLEGGLK